MELRSHVRHGKAKKKIIFVPPEKYTDNILSVLLHFLPDFFSYLYVGDK